MAVIESQDQFVVKKQIATIREILYGVSEVSLRLRACELAEHMIRENRFNSPSAKWDAFHDALRIIVEGGLMYGNYRNGA